MTNLKKPTATVHFVYCENLSSTSAHEMKELFSSSNESSGCKYKEFKIFTSETNILISANQHNYTWYWSFCKM